MSNITDPYAEPQPWERQHKEPSKAFHAFAHYRDYGATRSIDKACLQHEDKCKHKPIKIGTRANAQWTAWSTGWGWVERAAAYDSYVDRMAREASLKETIEARQRHANLAKGAMTALTVPVRALLQSLADPNVMASLQQKVQSGAGGAMEVLSLLSRTSAALPMLIQMERLALGMSTETIEVEDKREFDFANLVAKDPEATELAIALLDRVGGTGPGTAVGPGSPSKPG